jgi:hypothetical protein
MRRWGGIRHIHTYSLHSFTHIHTVINEATWDTFILPGFLPLVAHAHSVFATFCEFNSPASLRPPLQQPHGTRSPNFLPTVAYAYTVATCITYGSQSYVGWRRAKSCKESSRVGFLNLEPLNSESLIWCISWSSVWFFIYCFFSFK